MESGEQIDVTEYVREKKYEPFFCNGSITRLIAPEAYVAERSDNAILKKYFYDWANNSNDSGTIALMNNDTLSLWRRTSYCYSYIIFKDMVDVYVTKFQIGERIIQLYVRRENNIYFGPYMENGWVTCSVKGGGT